MPLQYYGTSDTASLSKIGIYIMWRMGKGGGAGASRLFSKAIAQPRVAKRSQAAKWTHEQQQPIERFRSPGSRCDDGMPLGRQRAWLLGDGAPLTSDRRTIRHQTLKM